MTPSGIRPFYLYMEEGFHSFVPAAGFSGNWLLLGVRELLWCPIRYTDGFSYYISYMQKTFIMHKCSFILQLEIRVRPIKVHFARDRLFSHSLCQLSFKTRRFIRTKLVYRCQVEC